MAPRVINIVVSIIVQLLWKLSSHRISSLCQFLLGFHVFVSASVCLWDVHRSVMCQVLLGPLSSGLSTFTLSAIENLYIECICFKCVSHYVSNYCNCYYSTSDSCVLQGIIYQWNCYNGSHPYGLSSFELESCATTVHPGGHSERFCWPCYCTVAAKTLSPRCLVRHVWTMPWVVLSWVCSFKVNPPTKIVVCFCFFFLLFMAFAFCFKVPMWLLCLRMGALPLGFAMLQSYGV